jgi:hypothetical protein
MRFEIEFFVRSEDHPGGETIRRNSGHFASEKDVEIYGLSTRPSKAEGFHIWKGGVVRKAISIQSKTGD